MILGQELKETRWLLEAVHEEINNQERMIRNMETAKRSSRSLDALIERKDGTLME